MSETRFGEPNQEVLQSEYPKPETMGNLLKEAIEKDTPEALAEKREVFEKMLQEVIEQPA